MTRLDIEFDSLSPPGFFRGLAEAFAVMDRESRSEATGLGSGMSTGEACSIAGLSAVEPISDWFHTAKESFRLSAVTKIVCDTVEAEDGVGAVNFADHSFVRLNEADYQRLRQVIGRTAVEVTLSAGSRTQLCPETAAVEFRESACVVAAPNPSTTLAGEVSPPPACEPGRQTISGPAPVRPLPQRDPMAAGF